MDKAQIDEKIIAKLRVKRGDNLPFTGWNAYRSVIPEILAELGHTKGAEIGVAEGFFTEAVCKANPELEMLCVDPWQGCIGYSSSKMARIHRSAMARLANCKATIMRMSSSEAAQQISNCSLDFVYIDALHDFDSVIRDLIYWVPKVRSGGIVAGGAFDNVSRGGNGVIYAVEAYATAHNILPWYVTHLDVSPSWLWVRG